MITYGVGKGVVKKDLLAVKKYMVTIKKEGKIDIILKDVDEYVNILNQIATSYQSKCNYKVVLKKFLHFYSLFFENVLTDEIEEYLTEIDKDKINAQKEAGKTPLLPSSFY